MKFDELVLEERIILVIDNGDTSQEITAKIVVNFPKFFIYKFNHFENSAQRAVEQINREVCSCLSINKNKDFETNKTNTVFTFSLTK